MNKKVPMRRCVACMESKEKDQLIRVALLDGKLVVDKDFNLQARGAYVCKNKACIEKALNKGGFSRSFRTKVSTETINELKDLY